MDIRIESIINNIKKNVESELNALYSYPHNELAEIEKQKLTEMSIALPEELRKEVKSELMKAGIPRVNLIWQGISERLPSISFNYIDWNSLKKENAIQYERTVTKDNYNKANNGMLFPVVCGCLAVGSIALIFVSPAGNPLKKIAMMVSVVSIVVGGVAIVKSTQKNQQTDSSQELKKPVLNPEENYMGIIENAKYGNMRKLSKWCEQVETVLRQEIES